MNLQGLMSPILRAIHEYKLIEDGDKVVIGMSGGKDSLLLSVALSTIQKYFDKKFELIAVHVDHGFTEITQTMIDGMTAFLDRLDIKLEIVPTNIKQIIFEEKKLTNPCWLCARLRRAALCVRAQELGFNKVALGHHKDDVIETLFLSMFYEGRFSTLQPWSFLDKTNTTVIRPLMYVDEPDIIANAKKNNFPVIKSPCPYDGNTQRQYIKDLLRNLKKDIPFIKDRIMSAIEFPERNNLWDKLKKQPPFDKVKSKK